MLVCHLFDSSGKFRTDRPVEELFSPSVKEQTQALLAAIHRSLVQCKRQEEQGTPFRITLPELLEEDNQNSPKRQKHSTASTKFAEDGFAFHPAHLRVFEVATPQELLQFLKEHLHFFVEDGGTILLLYSLVLSRGIQQVSSHALAKVLQCLVR